MAAFKVVLITTLIFFLPIATVSSHNITEILELFPEFSSFNNYLTITNLSTEINNLQSVTVLAVYDPGMKELFPKNLDLYTIKNILSRHVLLDYIDMKQLIKLSTSTELTATLFQATGKALGNTGFVNITTDKFGAIKFGTEDSAEFHYAKYIDNLIEIPYSISVIDMIGIFPTPKTPTLDPKELSKGEGSPVPMMAPKSRKMKPKYAPAPVNAPANSPKGVSDSSNAVEIKGFSFVVVVLGFWFVLVNNLV